MPFTLNKEVNDKIGGASDKKEGVITTSDSKVPVVVIPTNEEYIILRDTYEIAQNLKKEQERSNEKVLTLGR